MKRSLTELYDIDARNDPHLAAYERARDLLQTSDWRRGLQELEQLAHSGSLMSMLLVSDAMRDGWMYDQDLAGAEAWYQVAAKSGSARGLFGLGLTHLLMDRHSEAIQDLEAAIARDFPPALNALAGIYFRGDGVPVDRRKARDLWRRGASLGHLPSMRNLVKQALRGRLGFVGFAVGILTFLPTARAMATIPETSRYSDRYR